MVTGIPRGMPFPAVLLLLGALDLPGPPKLPDPDRARLAEAIRLGEAFRDRLWPGWGRTPVPILLVADSAEFLVDHPRPGPEFQPLGYDTLLGREVLWRPRRFPPGMLATFPAVGGLATVVIGTASGAGKSSVDWVLTVLHEQFHQWQFSLPDYYRRTEALGLARGDTTGQWMLRYPFPYDSAPIRQAARRLGEALVLALDLPPDRRAEALRRTVSARDGLRAILSAADWRYLEFQLWQEGVCRYLEYAAARAAGRSGPSFSAFRRLSDHEPYEAAAVRGRTRLRQELAELDLGRQRRVAFYALGAAMALLLEESRPDWKLAYADGRLELAAMLAPTP